MDYKIEQIPVSCVTIPERHRPLRSGVLDSLAQSIAQVGLRTPISVYQDGPDGDVILVAGQHRLKACERLEWDFIPAIFLDKENAIEREMWEIDENLIRAELTPSEEASHLKRRKELWEKREGFGKSLPETSVGGRPSGFATETSEALGKSKRAINLAIARADKIAPDVLRIVAGTSLDNGASLDKIARMPVEQQRRVASEVKLDPMSAEEVSTKWRASFIAVWNKGSTEDREWALAAVDKPVFDASRNGRRA
jgi:hypothetical protein